MLLWGCCNTSIWQGWIQKWCCGVLQHFYLAGVDPEMVLWGVLTLLFGRGGSRNGVVGVLSSIYFYL